jgi:reactive intermediate/imine deaminase
MHHLTSLLASTLLLALALTGCVAVDESDADAQMRGTAEEAHERDVEFLAPDDDWPYPFSPAVRVGNMLYLSGQVGNRPGETTVVEGGIEAESRQTLDNVKRILEDNGASMEDVVKCSVMLEEMADWPRFNEIYREYFPGPKPARSAWGADGLALNALVEVECWAAI